MIVIIIILGSYPQIAAVPSPRTTPTTSSETPGSMSSSQGIHEANQSNGNETSMVQNGIMIAAPPTYPATNPFISGNGMTNNNYMSLSPSGGLNLPFRHQAGYPVQTEPNRTGTEEEQNAVTSVGSYGYYRGQGGGFDQSMLEAGYPGTKVPRQGYADISRLGNHAGVNGHHVEELDENANSSTPKVWRPY